MDPSKLDKMKVVELRAELQARGLDTKGVKAILVERLKTAVESEIFRSTTEQHSSITPVETFISSSAPVPISLVQATPSRRSRRTHSSTRSPSPDVGISKKSEQITSDSVEIFPEEGTSVMNEISQDLSIQAEKLKKSGEKIKPDKVKTKNPEKVVVKLKIEKYHDTYVAGKVEETPLSSYIEQQERQIQKEHQQRLQQKQQQYLQQEQYRQLEQEKQQQLEWEKQQKLQEQQCKLQHDQQQQLEIEQQRQLELEKQQLEQKKQQKLQQEQQRKLQQEQQRQLELEKQQLEREKQQKLQQEQQRKLQQEQQRQIELEEHQQLERQKQQKCQQEQQRKLQQEQQRQIELEEQQQLEREKQLQLENKRQIELKKQQQLEREKQQKFQQEQQRKLQLKKQQQLEREKQQELLEQEKQQELLEQEKQQQLEQKSKQQEQFQKQLQEKVDREVMKTPEKTIKTTDEIKVKTPAEKKIILSTELFSNYQEYNDICRVYRSAEKDTGDNKQIFERESLESVSNVNNLGKEKTLTADKIEENFREEFGDFENENEKMVSIDDMKEADLEKDNQELSNNNEDIEMKNENNVSAVAEVNESFICEKQKDSEKSNKDSKMCSDNTGKEKKGDTHNVDMESTVSINDVTKHEAEERCSRKRRKSRSTSTNRSISKSKSHSKSTSKSSRSRSRSKSRLKSCSKSFSRSPRQTQRKSPAHNIDDFTNEEDEPVVEDKQFGLSWFDSDLHLRIDPITFNSAKPLHEDVFGLVWAGARTNYGVKHGKVVYEIRISEELLPENFRFEEDVFGFRAGFSLANTNLQLGECVNSFAYCSTGKKASNGEFLEYGKPFGLDDVIGCYLDLESSPCKIFFTLNGEELGTAFEFDKEILNEDSALFPHVLTKGYAFQINLADNENLLCNIEKPLRHRKKEHSKSVEKNTTEEDNDAENWDNDDITESKSKEEENYLDKQVKENNEKKLIPEYKLIALIPEQQYIPGPPRPENRKECEVILMVGLPGAGKTHWVQKYVEDNLNKKYNIIGADTLIEKMKIDGNPRKEYHSGKWEKVYEFCLKSLATLEEIATKRRRNYILDQTNVFASDQRRKMKGFGDFRRIAVVCIPNEEEYKRRNDMISDKEGYKESFKELSLNKMKANFTLPSVEFGWFDEVRYTDLDEDEAKNEVKKYNEKGNKAIEANDPSKYKRPRRDNYRRDDRRRRDDHRRYDDRGQRWKNNDRRDQSNRWGGSVGARGTQWRDVRGYGEGYGRRNDRYSGSSGQNWAHNYQRHDDRFHRQSSSGSGRYDHGSGRDYSRDYRYDRNRNGSSGSSSRRDSNSSSHNRGSSQRDFRSGHRDNRSEDSRGGYERSSSSKYSSSGSYHNEYKNERSGNSISESTNNASSNHQKSQWEMNQRMESHSQIQQIPPQSWNAAASQQQSSYWSYDPQSSYGAYDDHHQQQQQWPINSADPRQQQQWMNWWQQGTNTMVADDQQLQQQQYWTQYAYPSQQQQSQIMGNETVNDDLRHLDGTRSSSKK